MHGKILLICDDKSFTAYIKEQLFSLGDYHVIVETTANAGVASLGQSLCDLIFIRRSVAEMDTVSLML